MELSKRSLQLIKLVPKMMGAINKFIMENCPDDLTMEESIKMVGTTCVSYPTALYGITKKEMHLYLDMLQEGILRTKAEIDTMKFSGDEVKDER